MTAKDIALIALAVAIFFRFLYLDYRLNKLEQKLKEQEWGLVRATRSTLDLALATENNLTKILKALIER